MTRFFTLLKKAAGEFSQDDCMSTGAAMAYYAIFSLPPLLILVAAVAGYFGVEPEEIQRHVKEQLGVETLDEQAMKQQQAGGEEEGGLGMIWRIVGIAILVFSATGLFAQLQYALNRAWGVKPDPQQGGIMLFITKRVLSFGMIVVILFLLLISLVLTTVIDQVVELVQGASPSGVAMVFGFLLTNLATFAVATLLFATMFKVLPDVKMSWRDMWVGAAMTAFLFVVGKALIGLYIGHSDFGSSWGAAAGSLIGVLVWMYYSSLILLFGAELTQVWASQYGRGIRPDEGAVPA